MRSLLLVGLAEHWGSADPSLNPDLDDLAVAYPGSRTFVAVDADGTIAGTATLVPREDGVAEVVRMSVTTRLRGGDVGRLVLDALTAVALARGAERMVLETTASWTATIAFYERCGFLLTHYTDGRFGRARWLRWRGGVVAWWRGGVVAWWPCSDRRHGLRSGCPGFPPIPPSRPGPIRTPNP